ncbi:hypothetical protein AVEN_270149-1, partial [Araneus ventricosus]
MIISGHVTGSASSRQLKSEKREVNNAQKAQIPRNKDFPERLMTRNESRSAILTMEVGIIENEVALKIIKEGPCSSDPCLNGGKCNVEGENFVCGNLLSKENPVKLEKPCETEAPNYKIIVYFKESEECDCGVYGLCHFDEVRKKCDCAPLTDVPSYGKCEDCNCGVNASTIYIRSDGAIICSSDVAYNDSNGDCEECNCSYDDGWCSFEFGQKCLCIPQFTEKDGKCVGCDCGEGGSCHLNSSGGKICNCFSGYVPYEGYCM